MATNWLSAITDPLRVFRSKTQQTDDSILKGNSLSSSMNSPLETDIIKRVINTRSQHDSNYRHDNPSAISSLIQSTANITKSSSDENKQIMAISPEVSQAVNNIIIPSIISPNDMRPGGFSISIPLQFDPNKLKTICTYLEKYFNDSLNIEKKLSRWIKEMLYEWGAKPLIIIPISELDRKFNDKSTIANESLRFGDINDVSQLIKSIEDSSSFNSKKDVSKYTKNIHLAVEQLMAYEMQDELNYKPSRKNVNLATVESQYTDIISSESLKIIDNPDILKVSNLLKDQSDRNAKHKISTQYTYALIDELKDTELADNLNDHPLLIEPDMSSVIPIYLPSTPSEHLGYYAIIDEFGSIVKVPDMDTINNDISRTNEFKGTFSNIYSAYGNNDIISKSSPVRINAASIVYQKIMHTYLRDKIKEVGYLAADIGMNNAVYQYMFSRYLQNRQTRLLFIPRDFVVYMCDEYTDIGTGKSYLEDIKPILSMRMTLMVTYLIATMHAAVPRKKITIDGTGIKNPMELTSVINTVMNMAKAKDMVGLSWAPSNIMQSIADKSISVIPKGMAGLENFMLETERYRTEAPSIDDTVNTDLKNQLLLKLSVPPSAANALNENEFASGIATVNLLFSRFILAVQIVVCGSLEEFVKRYIRYSKPLQDYIISQINGIDENEEQHNVDGDLSDEDKTKQRTELLNIIDNIKVHLPSPNISPNNTQLENIAKLITNIDALLTSIFPDELATNNSELQEALAVVRATTKQQIVKQLSDTMGLSEYIKADEMSAAKINEMLGMREMLTNIKRAIEDVDRLITKKDNADTMVTPSAEPSDQDTNF